MEISIPLWSPAARQFGSRNMLVKKCSARAAKWQAVTDSHPEVTFPASNRLALFPDRHLFAINLSGALEQDIASKVDIDFRYKKAHQLSRGEQRSNSIYRFVGKKSAKQGQTAFSKVN